MNVETLLSDPKVATAVSIILLGAVLALRNVTPRRALLFEPLRTVAWRALDPVARTRGRPLVREKTDQEDEHIATVDCSELALATALWDEGYRWNPISTKKYRDRDGRQWSILSAVYRDSVASEEQHHVYVFRNGGGTLDVYGHHEASVTSAAEHHGGEDLVSGDPEGRFLAVADHFAE